MTTKEENRALAGATTDYDSRNPYGLGNIRDMIGEDAYNAIFASGDEKKSRFMDVLTTGLDYEAQLKMLDYENEYNSPAAKADRMRQAGLNPDLLGIEGVSDMGTAPQAQLGQITKDTPISQRISTYSDVINSGLQTLMQLGSGMQNIRSQALDNRLKATESMQKSYDLQMKMARGLYTYDDVKKYDDYVSDHGDDNGYLMPSYHVSAPKGASRAERRFYENMNRTMWLRNNDLRRQIYQDESQSLLGRVSSDQSRAMLGSFGDETFEDGMRAIYALQNALASAQAKAGTSQAKYNNAYFGAASGVHDAFNDRRMSDLQYDMANWQYGQAKESATKNDINNIFYKAFGKTVNNLVKDAENGKTYAQILLGFGGFAMMFNQMGFSLPNFSYRSGPKGGFSLGF